MTLRIVDALNTPCHDMLHISATVVVCSHSVNSKNSENSDSDKKPCDVAKKEISIFTPMSLPADVISKIIQCLMGLNVYKIILFGSYASNTATEDSDIDLVVILDTDEFAKSCGERMARRRPVSTALREVNRTYSIDIIVYSKGEFEFLDKKESEFVREVMNTGKELYAK